jgi:phosphoribosylaminoimidazolecarboxamide formyltransferase/IMP cyclohydrolase
VALVPKNKPEDQKLALIRAWEGDTVSAFGGVVVLSDLLEEASADWLSERFVELVAAPGLETGSVPLQRLLERRKKLKAVALREVVSSSREFSLSVVGARLTQTADLGCGTVERLNSVTERAFPEEKMQLAQFGVSVCRALKSNAIALVREIPGGFQLVGAGQGQPNRIDALNKLAIPRAQAVLVASGGKLADCVLVSDAFFPFRDSVDAAYAAGVRFIVQPGGSVRDKESVDACNEHKMAMALTGVRHFRH